MSFRAALATGRLGRLAALVLAVVPTLAHGQIRGTVVGSDARPVAGAYLAIRRAGAGADTTVAASTRTDSAGVFRVRGLEAGPYAVSMRALGFAALVRARVDLAASTSDSVPPWSPTPVDLGRLALIPFATRLEGVRVIDESLEVSRPIVHQPRSASRSSRPRTMRSRQCVDSRSDIELVSTMGSPNASASPRRYAAHRSIRSLASSGCWRGPHSRVSRTSDAQSNSTTWVRRRDVRRAASKTNCGRVCPSRTATPTERGRLSNRAIHSAVAQACHPSPLPCSRCISAGDGTPMESKWKHWTP